MIPVQLQPEPADFDAKVRQKGHAWLREQGIALDGPVPAKTKLPACWQAFNPVLWKAYSGTCAYLAIYFEFVTGASSTDHFIAKSSHAGKAYEWDNYRLACLGPNRNKNRFDDLLDPIGLPADTFVLDLLTGAIKPNPAADAALKQQARSTIRRLKLDSVEHREMRVRHFTRYLRGKDADTLRELSPFVWYEAQRQGLL